MAGHEGVGARVALLGLVGLAGLLASGCDDDSHRGAFASSPVPTPGPRPIPVPTTGGPAGPPVWGIAPFGLSYGGALPEALDVALVGAALTDSSSGAGAVGATAWVDWGDGTAVDQVTLGPGGAILSMHRYDAEGGYRITVTAADPAGSSQLEQYLDVTVINAPPTFPIPLPSEWIDPGETVTVVASFDDGASDAHTATMDWGDGSRGVATVDSATRTVSAQHVYTKVGRFTGRVALSDGDALAVTDFEVYCGPGPYLIGSLRGMTAATRVVAAAGALYVADRAGGAVLVLDAASGRRLETIARPAPISVAVRAGATPTIYVGDESDGSVRLFRAGREVGALGVGAGELLRPAGLAVLASGWVYVCDSVANTVAVYDDQGARRATIGPITGAPPGNDTLWGPSDVVVDEAAGDVYVADYHHARVVVFNLAGSWMRTITPPLNTRGDPCFDRPSGLGLAADGTLYVADPTLACVAAIAPTGGLVALLGFQSGRYWTGELTFPADVARDGRLLYVVSADRIDVLEVGP